MVKAYRGGMIKNTREKVEMREDDKRKESSKLSGKIALSNWHDFYASVKDNELFKRFPKQKRVAISLFYQGMKRYGVMPTELFAMIDAEDIECFDDYKVFTQHPSVRYPSDINQGSSLSS